MKINKRNLISILFVSGVLIFGLSNIGNSIKTSLGSNSSISSNVTIGDIEKQTQILRNKQDSIKKLSDNLSELDSVISQKTSSKITLEQKTTQIQTEIQKTQIEVQKQQSDILKLEKGELDFVELDKKYQIEESLQKTQQSLQSLQESQNTTKTEIQKTQAELESLSTDRKNLQENINQQNGESNNKFREIINIVLLLASNYVIYFILLISYWAIYKFLKYLLKRDVHNEIFQAVSQSALKTLWILTSILTVLYAFAGQFAYFFTSLGFVSAALVFALQNFIASFFVFVVLNFTKIFKEGDIIKVGPSFEDYTGKIINIGRLYTFIREINPENHEEIGRTVAIPNNFLLTHPITNYTFHNKIIWQNLKIIVREESNQVEVKKLLESIVTDRYQWMKSNLENYLDEDAAIEEFEPSIFMSLDEKGFLYTLHFPCRYDKYNFVYNTLLTDIISEFEVHGFRFAFNK